MHAPVTSPWIRNLFSLAVAFSALTGFAQMPIFKRYYIADIPGLGWLAEYYVTYNLHYLSAILVAGLGAYLLTTHLLMPQGARRLAFSSYVQAGLLILIVISGGLLVIRNLPGYRFSPQVVVALDFAHLGMVMLFLMTAFSALLFRKHRTADKH
jgi:hypothetical protein